MCNWLLLGFPKCPYHLHIHYLHLNNPIINSILVNCSIVMTVQQFWLKFINYLHYLPLYHNYETQHRPDYIVETCQGLWTIPSLCLTQYKNHIQTLYQRPPNLKLTYNKIKFYLLICSLSNKWAEFIKLNHITSKTGLNWLQMNTVNCHVHKIMTLGTRSLC